MFVLELEMTLLFTMHVSGYILPFKLVHLRGRPFRKSRAVQAVTAVVTEVVVTNVCFKHLSLTIASHLFYHSCRKHNRIYFQECTLNPPS